MTAPGSHLGAVNGSFLAITALMLASCGGAGGGGGSPAVPADPPRPSANDACVSVVQASGAQQDDTSTLVQNDAIVGEVIAPGTISAAGPTVVRHGFAPPHPPGWPTGVARNGPRTDP